ncbi:MAG: SDR family NAD(P)-dependent oxidoreductase [Anaerolineales bacterium]
MWIDLAGKNALVTGGAGGIGRACAQTLAQAGARVAVVDIDLAGAQQTVEPLQGGLAIECDLSDPDAVISMRDHVMTEMGGIDILINSAGIISYKKGIDSVPLEEWDTVLDVNLRGVFLVCQAFMDEMKQRQGGKIVNFSSLAARVGGIDVGIHYAASKAGLIGLTRTLAKEGGPFGINVNAIAPGIIGTKPVQAQIGGREDEYTSQIPLERIGEPQDVANVVLFLASSLSDYVTGIVLDINGGMYMG